MAGDWIPMRTDLWDCPEVVRIMSAMCPDIVRDSSKSVRVKSQIIGAMFRTWSLFDTYTDDGILDGYTAETLNNSIGIESWAENMQHVGWLVIEPQRLVMPSFSSWLSSSAKARLRDAQRKRNQRKNQSGTCPENVRNSADKKRTTEEKRREEKNNNTKKADKPPLSLVVPSSIQSLEFLEAWERWLKYRKEIKKPLTQSSAQAQLDTFAVWGPERAIAAISHTILMQWQGLREPDAKTLPASAQKRFAITPLPEDDGWDEAHGFK